MKIRVLLLLSLFSVGIIGCGGGSETISSTFKGRVVKGVISNADVSAHFVSEDGQRSEALAQTKSNDSGYYQLVVEGELTKPVLIVVTLNDVTSDNITEVICDTEVGCFGDPEIKFGEKYKIDNSVELLTFIAQPKENKENTVNVSLFSHLAAKYAYQKASNGEALDLLTVAKANSKVSDLLQDLSIIEIQDNVISIETPDITNIDEINEAVTDERESSLQYAIFNASIARFISNNYQQDLLQSINQISATFVANNGEVSLYTKSADFSIQALLEGMQSEVNHLESLHSDLNLSVITEIIDRELDELNIKDNNLPKPEVKEKEPEDEETKETKKDVKTETVIEHHYHDVPVYIYLPAEDEIIDDDETTHSFFYGQLENSVLSELDNAKQFVKSLRTIGYTLEENTKKLSNRIIEGLGGEVDVETVTGDFLDYVNIAKKSYPHVAAVTLAMIQMAEAEQDDIEYDLGEDEDDYLPKEINISGIVKKTTKWGSVYLTLQNSEIDGLGKIDLKLRLWQSYYCYYCYGYEYADVDVTVDGKYGKIHLQDWGTRIERTYNYHASERVPNSISLDDANIAITFSKEGSSRSITVSGETDAHLYWPGAYYTTTRLLPQLQRVSINGQFYNWQSDVSYFDGRLNYYNNDYYYRTDDPVDWAKQHAEDFSIEATFSTRVKVPDPALPTYAQYKYVNLSAGFRSGYSERKWLGFNYDGEAIRIEQSSTDYDYERRYRFSNRAGAIVDAIVNTDSREVLSSKVAVNGQSVAKIESSDIGPIIRYSDGTFESF